MDGYFSKMEPVSASSWDPLTFFYIFISVAVSVRLFLTCPLFSSFLLVFAFFNSYSFSVSCWGK